jgi:CMP-N,N'-diacetyllegionaminic acid synthase
MIGGERVIAVIPARGGSKSVPGKNIKPLGGRPLIAWSIEIARKTKLIDRVIVSTDDGRIGAVARETGAEVYERPAPLATDHSLVIDALRDLIRTLRREGETAGIMVLLEPTCPLRSIEDVEKCLELMAAGYDSVATFKEADLNPHRAWLLQGAEPKVFISDAIPWLPRQMLPKAYLLNGAVFAFKAGLLPRDGNALLFGKCGAVIMPRDRSVDIDDGLDFELVEMLIRRKSNV